VYHIDYTNSGKARQELFVFRRKFATMATNNYKVRDVQPTVLRLDPDLRQRLVRDAKAHGRSLSKEIEMLLGVAIQYSENASYSPPPRARALHASEPGADHLTDMEHAVLSVFRKLPPEKQLALLSLFK
jgi:hypothetical protein